MVVVSEDKEIRIWISGDTWDECYNDLVDMLVAEARAENCMENIRERVSA